MAISPTSPAYIESVEGDGLTAVYPWLANVHAWTLAKIGQKEEALTILKNVEAADLTKESDFMPSGYINSKNGKNGGTKLSGANADIFATVYFGLAGNPLVSSAKNIQPVKSETTEPEKPSESKANTKSNSKETSKKAPVKAGSKTLYKIRQNKGKRIIKDILRYTWNIERFVENEDDPFWQQGYFFYPLLPPVSS